MRPFRTIIAGLLIAVPAVAVTVQARAETDWMGQAQRLLNPNNNNDDRDAYERGRRDEMRRQQADRDRSYHRDSYRDTYGQRGYNDRDDRWRRGYDNSSNGGYPER